MFDPVELRIMEAVPHFGDMADVGAKHDKQALDAVYSLVAKGFLTLYNDGQVSATKEGIAALRSYHQELKEASKQEAARRAEQREKDKKDAKRDIARFLINKIIK